jgi:hypothetical protein
MVVYGTTVDQNLWLTSILFGFTGYVGFRMFDAIFKLLKVFKL